MNRICLFDSRSYIDDHRHKYKKNKTVPDPKTLNLLDLNQWSFYILTKEELKNVSNNRSSISLAKLEKYNILPLRYKEVKDYINRIIKNA